MALELTNAAAKMRAPSGGSMAGDLSRAIAGLLAGVQERQRQRKEDARKDALFKLEQEQTGLQRRQVELAERKFETEVAEAEKKRQSDEAGKLARLGEIERYTKQLGMPFDRPTLEQMSADRLNEFADDLRARVGQIEDFQARMEGNRTEQLRLQVALRQAQDAERREIIQELQRVEAAIGNARILRQQVTQQLEGDLQTRVGLRKQAAEIAKQTGRNVHDVLQDLFNQELDRRYLSVSGGSENLGDLMKQATQLRARLGQMRGISVPQQGTVDGVVSWSSLDPSQRQQAEASIKQAIMSGAQVDLDPARMAGWPVDVWLDEVQNNAPLETVIGNDKAADPIVPQGPLSTPLMQQIDQTLRLPVVRQAPQPPPNPMLNFSRPQLGSDPVFQRWEQATRLRRKGISSTPPAPAPGGFNFMQ